MSVDRLRVGLHVGQLLQPVPGGIGRYVERLLEHLPAAGVDIVPFSAGRPHPAPPGHVDLGRPRGGWRYETWHRLGRPRLRLDVDVIHATSLAVPPSGDTPMVVTVHDVAFLEHADYHTRRGHAFHRRGFELARRDAAVLVVPSAFVAAEVARAGVERDRIVVAHHGVDDPPEVGVGDVDAALSRLGVREPFLLHVGTAEFRKGTDTLLRAFSLARARHPDLELALVSPGGWGRLEPVPGSRALGGVDDADLDALYRRASALVYPSRHEGFGMPVLEAMAHRCPVISSTATAIPEVAGDAALLVDPDDPAGLAEAIDAVLDDAETRGRLVDAGRRRAGEFSWDASAETHVSAYRLARESNK